MIVMAKRKVVCARCSRERYEDRMTQGVIATSHNQYGTPTTWKKIEYWECSARTSCRSAQKERNRLARRGETN